MPKNGQSVKEANRAVRQETLREKLAAGAHLQLAIENIQNIEKLLPSDTFNQEHQKYKTAAELRLRLVNKYLPDLKNVEIANDGGGELTIKLVDFSDKHSD